MRPPSVPPLRARGLAVLAALVLVLAGCDRIAEMSFTQDHSLTITAPENLAEVSTPFEIRWTVEPGSEAERVIRDGGTYAVFLGRYPMAPGKDLRSVVDENTQCRGNDGCLEQTYLENQLGIYRTTGTSVAVAAVPVLDPTAQSDGSTYATVVLLDRAGARVGESVWYTGFKVVR